MMVVLGTDSFGWRYICFPFDQQLCLLFPRLAKLLASVEEGCGEDC